MEKLIYEKKVMRIIEGLEKNFLEQGLTSDTRYLDYHNSICPRCGEVIKTYRGEVKGLASVSSFLVLELKKAVLYGLCKTCVKELSRVTFAEHKTEETEERIFDKFPDLRRVSEERTNEKEIKMQREIFTKASGAK